MSDLLNDTLLTYRIGPKLKALRRGKGLGLSQLGEHSGLSAGMLSKIERGQVIPTLPTLLRIALVFGVGLDHFFAEGEDTPTLAVVRAADRLKLPDTVQGPPAYFFESLDFPVPDRDLQAYLADFPPDGPESGAHRHDGVELIYVLRGTLVLSIHEAEKRLEAGDSVYFDSGFDHSYRAGGSDGALAMVVVHDS